jgi:hypothetical protein
MHIGPIEMQVESAVAAGGRQISIGSVAGARYCGRDIAAMRQALDEQLGHDGRFSSATATNPSVFRIARYLLTQAGEFEVQGAMTGGEAEVVAIRDGEDILISLGSDQCDRELDPLFPDKPKQMCPHPLARVAWDYAEVRDHWDELRISSHVVVGGYEVQLQDNALATVVTLDYLLEMESLQALPDPMFLYCGCSPFVDGLEETVAQLGLPEETGHGVGDVFHMRLHDPVLGRAIDHRFSAVPLGDDRAERQGRPVI